MKKIGANEVIGRLGKPRPLGKEIYAGVVDTVGGDGLTAALGQTMYGKAIASCGNAGGPAFAASVFPFILRGVKLLGIESVQCPREERMARLKQRVAERKRSRNKDKPIEKEKKEGEGRGEDGNNPQIHKDKYLPPQVKRDNNRDIRRERQRDVNDYEVPPSEQARRVARGEIAQAKAAQSPFMTLRRYCATPHLALYTVFLLHS